MKNRLLPATLLGGLILGLWIAPGLRSDPSARGSDLPAFSEALADLSEQVLQAVVHIEVVRTVSGEEAKPRLRNPFAPPEPQDSPGDPGPTRREVGFGSGFVLDAIQGFVVTNQHVVEDLGSRVKVTLHDGRRTTGDVLAVDSATDLAVVKIPAGFARAQLAWGDSDALRPGNLVLAVGNPYGLTGTTSLGVVSGLGRTPLRQVRYQDYLQFDAYIDRGSSGGPLLDMDGRVVGINTAIFGSAWRGVGYAAPSELAQRIVAELISHKEVRRGYLGVEGRDVTPRYAEQVELPRPYGGAITSVKADTPAGRAGLKVGDVILAVDGKEIASWENLKVRISSLSPGAEVVLRIWRDGVPLTKKLVLGEL